MKKVILSLSGGLDSSTLLAYLLNVGYEVETIGFCYGSKHNIYENQKAALIADLYNVSFDLINLSEVFSGITSSLMLTGDDIPEGHYTDKSMESTVVPSRNIIFISILSSIAWTREAGLIAVGIHQGDHAIYPDCRVEFFQDMNDAIVSGTGGKVGLLAPFIDGNKADIVKKGLELKVPYQLTRTCYKRQEIACGVCGSCVERLSAFHDNDAIDPIEYESETAEDASGSLIPASNRRRR